MKFPLHIETHDRRLGFSIMGVTKSLGSGESIVAPGGITLELGGILVRKAVGIPEVLQFIVDASINVDLALFATWLYDKLKDTKVERITIRRRVVTDITPDGIRQALEEEVRRE
jgi:hypothetical protein